MSFNIAHHIQKKRKIFEKNVAAADQYGDFHSLFQSSQQSISPITFKLSERFHDTRLILNCLESQFVFEIKIVEIQMALFA